MRTDKFKMIPETLILDERITKNDLVVYVHYHSSRII